MTGTSGREMGEAMRAYQQHSAPPGITGRRSGDPARGQQPAPLEPGKPGSDQSKRLANSVDEAARLTGLSRDLLYDEMRRGKLTYVKVGRLRLVTRHHLQQFLGDAQS
jgi:excisionase family DNA binding protein